MATAPTYSCLAKILPNGRQLGGRGFVDLPFIGDNNVMKKERKALYIAFDVEIDLHVTGSIFFILAFSILYDFLFLVAQYSFLGMRIKYLNIALMKTSNVKLEYLPKIFLFNGVLWKDRFNDDVTFHKDTDLKKYIRAFEMIYDHIRRLEKGFRFSDIELLRKMCITMLVVISWIMLMTVSLRSDIVLRQLEQTKVICIYAQLKPENNGDVFKLTKRLQKILESRDARPFIYGVFQFDSGMVVRFAASTFVYITVILQSRKWAFTLMEFGKTNELNSTITNP
ncbi:uncharacterized protein LOC135309704 [Plodia interpunctella]|uniref:uncharacterized protein LOC135309704 n=1 Tax=Plodia interpunctella TaxID=58824 RepID=UPI0031017488